MVTALDKTGTANDTPRWVYARCHCCGIKYRYVENSLYQPKTCHSYECLRQYLHHPREPVMPDPASNQS